MGKILVVQFRQDISKEHEQQCIQKLISSDDEVVFWDIFNPEVNLTNPAEYLNEFDKLILGGNGSTSLGEGHKNNDYKAVEYILNKMKSLVDYVLEHDFPTFGTCFGHQLLGHFLGVQVIYDTEQAETGFAQINVSEEAQNDQIFSRLRSPFYAVVGHQDSLEKLPDGAVLLASSEKCRVQAFRYKQNIYGTQFHGELNHEDLMYRLSLFPQYKQYTLNLKIEDSSEAVKTLQGFLER